MSPATPSVLGMRVPAWARKEWPGWFAPAEQPFDVAGLDDEERAGLPGPEVRKDLPLEVRDTFWLYGTAERVWLDQPAFEGLAPHLRRRLVALQRDVHEAHRPGPDGRRRAWWPGDGPSALYEAAAGLVAADRPDSQHARVSTSVWRRAEAVVPRARQLAGTLARGSGPNCFGTVLGAVGVEGAEDAWLGAEPLENWLGGHAEPVSGTGHDAEPGVVFVWRLIESGQAVHACVTLGDGWALNKPSQGWMSPRFVWPVRTAISQSRWEGAHVERHRIQR